jgi:plastocyanin
MPKSYRFAPESIQVPAGTTVVFRNTDNFTHSVKLLDGSEPDHLVKPGENVQIAFAQPGTFKYECSLHPRDMRGTVVVIAAPAADTYGR